MKVQQSIERYMKSPTGIFDFHVEGMHYHTVCPFQVISSYFCTN